jgi:hypothetical protein
MRVTSCSPRRRVGNAISWALSVGSCSLVLICDVLGCQDNNLCISLRGIRAKTLLSPPPDGAISRAAELSGRLALAAGVGSGGGANPTGEHSAR